jgi:hypothetical protein
MDNQDNITLSPEDLAHFAQQGYVRVSEALSSEYVAKVQAAIWEQLNAQYGIVQTDRATWKAGWCGINKNTVDKKAGKQTTPRLIGAVNQLLGEGNWRPLKTLGGLLLTLPFDPSEQWDRAFDWHVDNDPRLYLGSLDELMLFTFYSSVERHGGGTLILSGSHRLIEHYLQTNPNDTVSALSLIKDGLFRWHPYFAELTWHRSAALRSTEALMESPVDVHGFPVQVVELTGKPGDAILCHPALLHAISANCSSTPRLMRRTNFRRKREVAAKSLEELSGQQS